MATSTEKKKLACKLLEFQKKGLQQYSKYLDDQLKLASKSEHKKLYKKYIENQIAQTKTKIEKIDAKL